MLKKIYIDGFRHFKNFSFEPYEQATLLSGLNGTGKTTIVELVARLQLFLVKGMPVSSLCTPHDIPRWEAVGYGNYSTTLGMEIVKHQISFEYEIEIKHNFRESFCRVAHEILKIDGEIIFSSKEGKATVKSDDNRTFEYPVDWSLTGLTLAARNNSKIHNFLNLIKKNIYTVSINPFSISSFHKEEESILHWDGSNFSAWYAHLLDGEISAVASAFSEIAAFVPGFKQLVFEKEGKSKELVADISLSDSQAYRLSFENLSHGQKVLCILHLLIRVCPENSTILIDEFENFLAPVELQPLYDAAQDAFEEKNTQFIFVSHHQKTLNWFHDSAFILKFSGSPAFVRMEKFPSEAGLSIGEYLMANSV